jgi:hypothetical protein
MLVVAKEWDSIRGGYILICRESGQWLVVSGQWPVPIYKPWVRRKGAKEVAKRRKNAAHGVKPWVRRKGAREAAKRRKNAAHGVSRGSATGEGRAPTGRKILPHTSANIPRFFRRQGVRSSSRSSAQILFLSPPSGLVGFCSPTHGWRRGLHSCAASRLGSVLAVLAVRTKSTLAGIAW